MKRPLIAILFLGLVFGGCALMIKGTKEKVSFDAEPGMVDVYVNSVKVGTTPCRIDLRSNEEYTVEFRKEGFYTKSYLLSGSVSPGWVILDIVAGVLPVVVDAVTGAWYSLDQKHLKATLEKK